MARLYIKTPWSYETDFWVDVTSVNFNSKNVHEDNIFVRQDILQSFSGVSKDYKYVKSPKHEIGTLTSTFKATNVAERKLIRRDMAFVDDILW